MCSTFNYTYDLQTDVMGVEFYARKKLFYNTSALAK